MYGYFCPSSSKYFDSGIVSHKPAELQNECGSGAHQTPLLAAIASGSMNAFNLLLSRGAHLEGHQSKFESSIHCAARHGLIMMLERLLLIALDRGDTALGLYSGNFVGDTPLRAAIMGGDFPEMAEFLAARGAVVREGDLDLACEVGRVRSAVVLMRLGVRATLDTRTALCEAISGNLALKSRPFSWEAYHRNKIERRCVDELLERFIKDGVNIEGSPGGDHPSPVLCAIETPCLPFLKLLWRHGARMDWILDTSMPGRVYEPITAGASLAPLSWACAHYLCSILGGEFYIVADNSNLRDSELSSDGSDSEGSSAESEFHVVRLEDSDPNSRVGIAADQIDIIKFLFEAGAADTLGLEGANAIFTVLRSVSPWTIYGVADAAKLLGILILCCIERLEKCLGICAALLECGMKFTKRHRPYDYGREIMDSFVTPKRKEHNLPTLKERIGSRDSSIVSVRLLKMSIRELQPFCNDWYNRFLQEATSEGYKRLSKLLIDAGIGSSSETIC